MKTDDEFTSENEEEVKSEAEDAPVDPEAEVSFPGKNIIYSYAANVCMWCANVFIWKLLSSLFMSCIV